jgi:hypothetical protein
MLQQDVALQQVAAQLAGLRENKTTTTTTTTTATTTIIILPRGGSGGSKNGGGGGCGSGGCGGIAAVHRPVGWQRRWRPATLGCGQTYRERGQRNADSASP